MGTHPIFESDFDCLTECIMKVHLMNRRNKKECYIIVLVITALVTFYQFYQFSKEAYEIFLHPAFNWTCSNVDVIDYQFGAKCKSIRSYTTDDAYEYDYSQLISYDGRPDYGPNYGDQEIVTNYEAVQVVSAIRDEVKDKVKESFLKYLEEHQNGHLLKNSLQQMAESGEVEKAVDLVSEEVLRLTEDEISHEATDEATETKISE